MMSQEDLISFSPCQDKIKTSPEFTSYRPDLLTGSPFSDLETNLHLERESISGRESLGILHLSTIFLQDDSKVPDILLTINESMDENIPILNTGFYYDTFDSRNLIMPSISSQGSSNPSFHSCSLDDPSKIYSVSSVFNEPATGKSFATMPSGSLSSILNKGRIISPSELECRMRIRSLPENFNKDCLETDPECVDIIQMQHATFGGASAVNDENKSDKFVESIFIEAEYIASKIADGSILDEPLNIGAGVLDSTPAPNWTDFPEPEALAEECHTRLKEIIPPQEESFCEADNPTSSDSNSTDKIVAAKEMIENLSAMMNSTTHSDQQKREGQFLLNSFANLLCNGSASDSGNLIDSGHSSSMNESLELSRKSVNAVENKSACTPVINKKLIPKKRLSLSLNCSAITKNRELAVSNLTANSSKSINNDSSAKSKSDHSSNLLLPTINIKLKTNIGNKVSKKGPLKAVIPVKEIQKRSTKTPERTTNENASGYQSTKTSTPISESKINPIAASTPTFSPTDPNKQNSSLNSRRKSLASAQIKSQIAVKSRRSLPSPSSHSINTNLSDHSADDLKGLKPNPPKSLSSYNKDSKAIPASSSRRSLTHLSYKDMRRNSLTKTEQILGRKRSNSVGEATGLMSSMTKIRENLKNSPEMKKLKTLKELNGNVSKPFKTDISRKNSNQLLKPNGKENVAK